MIAGALSYVFYMICENLGNSALLAVAASINGFGAGFFWVLHGIWMQRMTENGGSAGLYTGIFFSIYNTQAILGNMVALVTARFVKSVTSRFEVPTSTLLWILIGGAIFATTLFVFMPNVSKYNAPTMNVAERIKVLLDFN